MHGSVWSLDSMHYIYCACCQRATVLGVWQCIANASSEVICGHSPHSSSKMTTHCAVNPATALGMFKTLDVPRGEWMLQTAAGSALGATLCCCPLHMFHRDFQTAHRLIEKGERLQHSSTRPTSQMSLCAYVQLSWLAPSQVA